VASAAVIRPAANTIRLNCVVIVNLLFKQQVAIPEAECETVYCGADGMAEE
jgi:hypothetical protein